MFPADEITKAMTTHHRNSWKKDRTSFWR